MEYSSREVISALREWDMHKVCHNHCQADDSGTWCPRRYPTLRMFLTGCGFHFNSEVERIFGRDLDEPNFRSDSERQEIPVKSPVVTHYLQLMADREADEAADIVTSGRRVMDRSTTTNVLSSRAGGPQTPRYGIATLKVMQDVQRLARNSERLAEENEVLRQEVDGLHESVRAINHTLRFQTERLDAMDEAMQAHIDNKVEPQAVLMVPADMRDEIAKQVDIRIERIRRQRELKERAGR